MKKIRLISMLMFLIVALIACEEEPIIDKIKKNLK